jgi:hypothetical protein
VSAAQATRLIVVLFVLILGWLRQELAVSGAWSEQGSPNSV